MHPERFYIWGTGSYFFVSRLPSTILKYWLKICNVNRNEYIWHIYNVLLSDINCSPNKLNWVSLVRDLLSHLGFQYVWLQQGVGNVTAFLSELRQRLTHNFVQNWNARLHDSSGALCYRNISMFNSEMYLECVTVRKFRFALA